MPHEGHQLAWNWVAGEQECLPEDPCPFVGPCCALQLSLVAEAGGLSRTCSLLGEICVEARAGNKCVSTEDRGKFGLP